MASRLRRRAGERWGAVGRSDAPRRLRAGAHAPEPDAGGEGEGNGQRSAREGLGRVGSTIKRVRDPTDPPSDGPDRLLA